MQLQNNESKKETMKNPHAVAMGRLGGSKKSEKKAEAARLNGRKPKKKKYKSNVRNNIKKY